MQAQVIVVLLLLVCGSGLLILDGFERRRMDRRLATALPSLSSGTPAVSSVRMQQTGGNRLLTTIRWLFKYDPQAVYMWPLPCTILAGLIVAAGIVYGGYFGRFSERSTACVALIGTCVMIRGLLGWQQHRYINKLFQQLPDVVKLITSVVKAGLPINEAFRVVAREMPDPSARQFAMVCDDVASGKSPEDALYGIYTRTHLAEYGMFAVTLAIQIKSGGRLAEILQTLGDTVQQRVALIARAKALAAEVIFSSKALSVSPVIIGGLLYLLSHQLLDMLFTDPRGRFLLACGVASNLMGVVVIRWMVRKDTSI